MMFWLRYLPSFSVISRTASPSCRWPQGWSQRCVVMKSGRMFCIGFASALAPRQATLVADDTTEAVVVAAVGTTVVIAHCPAPGIGVVSSEIAPFGVLASLTGSAADTLKVNPPGAVQV